MNYIEGMSNKQKESAAKKLCQLKGVHPDQMMAYAPDPEQPTNIIYMKSWEMALKLIEAQEELEIAMAHGRRDA